MPLYWWKQTPGNFTFRTSITLSFGRASIRSGVCFGYRASTLLKGILLNYHIQAQMQILNSVEKMFAPK